MRRWRSAALGLVLIGTLIGGPGATFAQSGTPAASPVGSCAEASREAMERVAHIWHEDVYAAKDPTLLEPYLSSDIVHHAAAFPDAHGPAALEAIFRNVMTGFPDAHGSADLVLVDAPYVVSSWTVSGTNSGEFQGNPPTGRVATWHGIDVYRFDCGKIVESWSELDQLGRLQQLGLLPMPQATPTAATPLGASPAACAPTPRDEAAAVVRRWWDDVWTGGKFDELNDLVAADEIHHWALGPDSVGPDAMRSRIAAYRTAFPDLTITYGHLVQDGDYVASTWVIRGTHTGTYMGMPPSGKSIDATGINIFRIDCGRIAEVWSEMDGVTMLSQIGAMPAATPEATPAA